MYQTTTTYTFSPEVYPDLLSQIHEKLDSFVAEGKTDGTRILDWIYLKDSVNGSQVTIKRTWIDISAANEWKDALNTILIEYENASSDLQTHRVSMSAITSDIWSTTIDEIVTT